MTRIGRSWMHFCVSSSGLPETIVITNKATFGLDDPASLDSF
jgi:hypothetical protein